MKPKILITPRSLTADPHPDVEEFNRKGYDVVYCTPGKTPSEEDLLALVPDCVGWLAGVETVSRQVINAAKHLRVISRNGVGTDNLPLDILRERGIRVVTADGANSSGVAELAVGLMFSALRSIPLADAGIKSGGWPRVRGSELRGCTVGIIGCGAIGGEVARMVSSLGAKVIAADPVQPDLHLPPELFRYAEVSEVLAGADILSLHRPLPRDGSIFLGKARLSSLKPGAILVNTARAGLVDAGAVVEALDEGRLRAYATDVFEQEPPADLKVAGHARVIATSHIGGFTAESVDRATRLAADNLLAVLDSERAI